MGLSSLVRVPLSSTKRKVYIGCGGFCLFIAFVSAILAGVLPSETDKLIASALREETDISSPSANGYARWASTVSGDVPPTFNDFTLFNITNPHEVLQGAKPKVKELPTASYIKQEVKLDIEWGPSNRVVSYVLWRYFEPANERTKEIEQMNVTTLNLPFLGAEVQQLGAVELLEDYDDLYQTDYEKLFVTRTVKEIIWGYDDPLLQLIAVFAPDITDGRYPGLQANHTTPDMARKQTGTNIISTGKGDPASQRQFIQWNGMKTMQCCDLGPCGPAGGGNPRDAWGTWWANRITGVYGDQFRPNIKKGEELVIWVDQLYRTATLTNDKDITERIQGISAERYSIPDWELSNTTLNPSNEAYYVNGASGVFNISLCSGNVPLLVTKPRFMSVSPSMANTVEYLDGPPSLDKHDTFIDVEPTAGIPLLAHERLQVNLRIAPVPLPNPTAKGQTTWFENLTAVAMPIVWLDQHAEITGELAEKVRKDLLVAEGVRDNARWVGGTMFAVFTVIGTFLLVVVYRDASTRAAHNRARLEHLGEITAEDPDAWDTMPITPAIKSGLSMTEQRADQTSGGSGGGYGTTA